MSNYVSDLVKAMRDGVAVLRSRDGVALTDAQIQERANNLAQAVLSVQWRLADEHGADALAEAVLG